MTKKKTSEEPTSESAGARIKRKGQRPVWVTFDEATHDALRVAAARARLSMSEYCRVAAAEKMKRESS
jgi:hypothetical protein